MAAMQGDSDDEDVDDVLANDDDDESDEELDLEAIIKAKSAASKK